MFYYVIIIENYLDNQKVSGYDGNISAYFWSLSLMMHKLHRDDSTPEQDHLALKKGFL